MKAYLIEFLNKFKKNGNDAASPTASVNVSTAKIKKINKATPTATEEEVEPTKLSQELGPKKARFLRRTLADFPKRL